MLIDKFLMVKGGQLQEARACVLPASDRYPCRNTSQNMANLAAQIAANATGVVDLNKIIRQFGRPVVQAAVRVATGSPGGCVFRRRQR